MPTSIDPRGQDNPSTYFVQDKSSEAEMIRLMVQDSMITAGMGGVLVEQPNAASLHRVLDVGCGPGGWLLETAYAYTQMSLVGIDISWKMIEYARAQAQAQKLTERTEFLVMDILKPLAFPDDTFDLVNMRFSISYMHLKDWPELLHELLRVTRQGGSIRVTEPEPVQSNSPALTSLMQMLLCAFYNAGHIPALDNTGITPVLARLLSANGCQHVQTKTHMLEYIAGTDTMASLYQDNMYLFQTLLPFLRKWNCTPEDYDAIYQQALIEMQGKDFHARWELLTAWGTKP